MVFVGTISLCAGYLFSSRKAARMNNLTKHETVWLQAYCAAIPGSHLPKSYGDIALKEFQTRFPPSPPPQKESVSGVAQEVHESQYPPKDRKDFVVLENGCAIPLRVFYHRHQAYEEMEINDKLFHVTELREGEVIVTREMLAKAAANLRPNWSQTDRLLMVEEFSKELGLKP